MLGLGQNLAKFGFSGSKFWFFKVKISVLRLNLSKYWFWRPNLVKIRVTRGQNVQFWGQKGRKFGFNIEVYPNVRFRLKFIKLLGF